MRCNYARQSDIIMRDYDIIEADEALAIVLQHALPLARPVALLETLDLVLAQDIIAPEDLPLPVQLQGRLCRYRRRYQQSTPSRRRADRWIYRRLAGDTGHLRAHYHRCAYASWADAVIMVEYTQEAHGMITMQGQVAPGADVRPIGQDITCGQRVLEAGMRLGPQEIGLLASLGYTSRRLSSPPRSRALYR